MDIFKSQFETKPELSNRPEGLKLSTTDSVQGKGSDSPKRQKVGQKEKRV